MSAQLRSRPRRRERPRPSPGREAEMLPGQLAGEDLAAVVAGFPRGRVRHDLLRRVSLAGVFVVAAQPTARSVSGDLPGILAQCPVGAMLWLRWKTLSGS